MYLCNFILIRKFNLTQQKIITTGLIIGSIDNCAIYLIDLSYEHLLLPGMMDYMIRKIERKRIKANVNLITNYMCKIHI